MRILALESSGLVASVAVVDGALDGKDAQTIAEYTVNYRASDRIGHGKRTGAGA